MLRLTTLMFTVFALSAAACGGQVAPAVPQGATIKSVLFHTTTVVIHGDPIVFDVTRHNPSATPPSTESSSTPACRS